MALFVDDSVDNLVGRTMIFDPSFMGVLKIKVATHHAAIVITLDESRCIDPPSLFGGLPVAPPVQQGSEFIVGEGELLCIPPAALGQRVFVVPDVLSRPRRVEED